MLIIDAANVIGSRPTGWWCDRPGAARRFAEHSGVVGVTADRARAARVRAANVKVVGPSWLLDQLLD
ncbi:MAG: hypothetical protein ABIR68_11380 [Ilumatobacteraceae bacterium]